MGDLLAQASRAPMPSQVLVDAVPVGRRQDGSPWWLPIRGRGGAPAHIEVWRSVRVGGDTKTPRSRRTLALSAHVVDVLREHGCRQDEARRKAGQNWREHDLVFPFAVGTLQDRHNVLRMFRDALRQVPGLDADQFSPRDLRHSFVSMLSERGIPIEEISRLMGHSGTAVTELVYRHELRPVLQAGASVMDAVFAHVRASSRDAGEAALDLREVGDGGTG